MPPATSKAVLPEASSKFHWLIRQLFVGAAITLTVKVALVEASPSLTVKVMVVEPMRPAAGVMVTVRLEPLPAKMSCGLAFETSVVSEEFPTSDKEPAAVSASPMVKGSGPVLPLA